MAQHLGIIELRKLFFSFLVIFVFVSSTLPVVVFAAEENGDVNLLDNSYDPATFTIYKNEEISFVNKSSSNRWPDLTYTITPKHKTYEFAANKPLSPGQEWAYKFPYAGKWQYKDKINPQIHGTINVIVGRGYSHVMPQQPQSWWERVIRFFQSVFHVG